MTSTAELVRSTLFFTGEIYVAVWHDFLRWDLLSTFLSFIVQMPFWLTSSLGMLVLVACYLGKSVSNHKIQVRPRVRVDLSHFYLCVSMEQCIMFHKLVREHHDLKSNTPSQTELSFLVAERIAGELHNHESISRKYRFSKPVGL